MRTYLLEENTKSKEKWVLCSASFVAEGLSSFSDLLFFLLKVEHLFKSWSQSTRTFNAAQAAAKCYFKETLSFRLLSNYYLVFSNSILVENFLLQVFLVSFGQELQTPLVS